MKIIIELTRAEYLQKDCQYKLNSFLVSTLQEQIDKLHDTTANIFSTDIVINIKK